MIEKTKQDFEYYRKIMFKVKFLIYFETHNLFEKHRLTKKLVTEITNGFLKKDDKIIYKNNRGVQK